jgi:hypothetical protein
MEIYSHLGKNEKLGLSGRPKKRIGILGTSKMYEFQNQQLTIFYPDFTNIDDNWISGDIYILIDRIKTELNYLQSHWHLPGRPTVVIPIGSELLWNKENDEECFINSSMEIYSFNKNLANKRF